MKEFKNLEKQVIYILYRNQLNTASFAHDAAYSDSKDLAKRELFYITFWKIQPMKLLEIVNMIDIKEH